MPLEFAIFCFNPNTTRRWRCCFIKWATGLNSSLFDAVISCLKLSLQRFMTSHLLVTSNWERIKWCSLHRFEILWLPKYFSKTRIWKGFIGWSSSGRASDCDSKRPGFESNLELGYWCSSLRLVNIIQISSSGLQIYIYTYPVFIKHILRQVAQ